jgi:hypothetical protein
VDEQVSAGWRSDAVVTALFTEDADLGAIVEGELGTVAVVGAGGRGGTDLDLCAGDRAGGAIAFDLHEGLGDIAERTGRRLDAVPAIDILMDRHDLALAQRAGDIIVLTGAGPNIHAIGSGHSREGSGILSPGRRRREQDRHRETSKMNLTLEHVHQLLVSANMTDV